MESLPVLLHDLQPLKFFPQNLHIESLQFRVSPSSILSSFSKELFESEDVVDFSCVDFPSFPSWQTCRQNMCGVSDVIPAK